jgi:hypothetical protein
VTFARHAGDLAFESISSMWVSVDSSIFFFTTAASLLPACCWVDCFFVQALRPLLEKVQEPSICNQCQYNERKEAPNHHAAAREIAPKPCDSPNFPTKNIKSGESQGKVSCSVNPDTTRSSCDVEEEDVSQL